MRYKHAIFCLLYLPTGCMCVYVYRVQKFGYYQYNTAFYVAQTRVFHSF